MSRLPRLIREALAVAFVFALYVAELLVLGPHMESIQ